MNSSERGCTSIERFNISGSLVLQEVPPRKFAKFVSAPTQRGRRACIRAAAYLRMANAPVKVNPKLRVSANEVVHPSLGKGGMFGLFNSIRSLIGFAFYCHESGIRLVLPTIETGYRSGVFHTFDELFVSARFIAAMASAQVAVHERLPVGTRAWVGSREDRIGMGRFTRYQNFLTRDMEAEANATTPSGSVADMFSRIQHLHPRSDPGLSYQQLAAVERAVYSGLRPAERITRTVRHIQRNVLGNEPYGCLHARIEKDIYAYHRYIGDGRPVQIATILRCEDACSQSE